MITKLFPPQREPTRAMRTLYDIADNVCVGVLAIALLFTFAARFAAVRGDSMLPTLHNGRPLFITAFAGNLNHGDVIVVSEAGTQLGEVIIKRVIGLPGDVIYIDFDAGVVLRNGVAMHEPGLDPIVPPQRCWAG
jgi:signal peptidase I